MEGAVVRLAAQQLDDAAHAALADGVFALDNQSAGTHAHDRAVPPFVEGQGGFGDLILGRHRAYGQETRADPFHQVVAGHIVGADDDDATAAAAVDPVLGDGDALSGAGAGGVHLGVGAARADILGELAMAHGQDAEQEATIEGIRFALQLVTQLVDAPVDLVLSRQIGCVVAQILQHFQLLDAIGVGVIPLELIGEAVAAGEGAGKNHAGVVAQGFGQHPAFGQILAGAGALVGLHQRDARLAQGVDSRGHRQLGGDVEGLDQIVRHAVFLCKIERSGTAGQLDDLGRVADRFEAAAAVLSLDQSGDPLVDDQVAEAFRDQIDELLAAQDAHGVVGIHDRFVGSGQAQAGAADDDRTERCLVAIVDMPAVGLTGCLQGLGYKLSQDVERRHDGRRGRH